MTDRSLVHLVLRHDLVLGRSKGRVHASVTQVDLHDFCRLAITYGLGGFHCVTELPAQRQICDDMLDFWRNGSGKDYNPDRATALTKLGIHAQFSDLLALLERKHGQKPILIGTSARHVSGNKTLDFDDFSDTILRLDCPVLIQFGTSWGLSPEQLSRCDRILSPIQGYDGYNHLSVRCAAAIIIDRLFH